MSYAIISFKKRKLFDKIETNKICDELEIKIPEFKENKQKIYGRKINKLLEKHKINQVVLSSEIKKFEYFKNIILQNSHYIITGKNLYKVLLPILLKDVSNLMKFEMEKMNLVILINEYNADNIELIKIIAEKVKSVTIITSNAYRFEQVIDELLKNQGIVIQLANQKKVNLKKKQIIVNLDFSNMELEQLNVPYEALIVTNSIYPIKMKRNFNGIIIRDIEVFLGRKIESFRTLELCEAYVYRSMKRIKENETRFQHSEYKINGYIGNNGKIAQEDFERLGNIFLKDKKQNIKNKA